MKNLFSLRKPGWQDQDNGERRMTLLVVCSIFSCNTSRTVPTLLKFASAGETSMNIVIDLSSHASFKSVRVS